jgi:hypothetical protein
MFRRGIVAIIVLAALSGIMIAAFAFSDNNNSKPIIQQSISNGSNVNPVSNSTINKVLVTKKNSNMVNNLLTPQEAKIISEKYINQTGVIPGTPKLINEGGKNVYIVPVLDNQTTVGEIHIDAHSGKNLGGAGGIKQ